VLVQNHGYASIGALSRSVGGAGYGTHYRLSENGALPIDDGRDYDPAPVDLAANAESLGARVLRAGTIDELRAALAEAKAHQGGPVVVHVETDRYAGVPSYESWWDVPVAEVGGDAAVREARAAYEQARAKQRAYIKGDSPSLGSEAMTELVVPFGSAVTPESAGWGYVGFEPLVLGAGQAAERDTGERECCIVVVAGRVDISSEHGEWRDLGTRATPFAGAPDAAYLPQRTRFTIAGEGEVGLCFAPAGAGAEPRVLPADGVKPETRGHGSHERTINAILMGDQAADSLLVCEVYTPPGHWSSYPPHKHDRDALPAESLLEETYYFRVDPPQGFALQRVYSDDRSLDETLSVRDRDTVLVPRGYHTVSAPPGYAVYYLNVMAGPARTWAVANDPDHEWTMQR
jgi:5-deoxy-glucuronate isomerase